MNVEIGAEAAQFPEKVYINGIAVAVQAVTIHQIKLALHAYCLWSKENKIFYSIIHILFKCPPTMSQALSI
jgi:hypothetical protein